MAIYLFRQEKVDIEVVKTAALLHDIIKVKEYADYTGKIDHAILSAKMSYPILKKLDFSDSKIKHIQESNCLNYLKISLFTSI